MKTLQGVIILLFSTLSFYVSAQNFIGHTSDIVEEEVAKATEFSIPPSPAFVMLDVTPSKIIKPGLPRAFKVDWSLQNYSIAPNLALEAQPIWLLAFNQKGLSEYKNASALLRMLSTLTVSLGTVAQDEQATWVAFGAKLNLLRSTDPLYDPSLLDSLDITFYQGKKERSALIDELKKERKNLKKDDSFDIQYDSLSQSIRLLQEEITQLDMSRDEAIQQVRKTYINENWNASYLDIAYGNRFTTFGSLDSLSVSEGRNSVWVNGSYGIGKKFLLGGMLQYSKDNALQSDQVMFGANVRYGNGNYNFFIETFLEQNTASELVEESTDFYIAYGGEFNINKNIILDYALRVRNVEKLGFKEFIPVVNVRCLMR